MPTIKVEIEKLECEKCGYQWEPIVKDPKKCPNCQHVPNTPIRNKKEPTVTPRSILKNSSEVMTARISPSAIAPEHPYSQEAHPHV